MSEYFHNPNTRTDRLGSIAPKGARNVGAIVIKRYPPNDAYTGADTWRVRGGMMKGPTGGNSLGVVPRAFVR
jgi:hypothetical protein